MINNNKGQLRLSFIVHIKNGTITKIVPFFYGHL